MMSIKLKISYMLSSVTGTGNQNAESIQIQNGQRIWRHTQTEQQAHEKMLGVLGPRDGRRWLPTLGFSATPLRGTGTDGMLSRRAWGVARGCPTQQHLHGSHNVTLPREPRTPPGGGRGPVAWLCPTLTLP